MAPDSPFRLDPELIATPDRFYGPRREEPPRYADEIDAWVIARHADVRAVLRHDGVRTSNRVAIGPRWAGMMRNAIARVLDDRASPPAAVRAAGRARWSLLNTADPPDHDRHRRLVGRAFAPRQVAAMEPRIAEIADRLLGRFVDGGVRDAVADLAEPFPAEVTAHMLGVPVGDIGRFLAWTADITRLFGNHDLTHDEFVQGLTSQGELMDYCAHLLDDARQVPTETLIGTLAQPDDDGDRLGDDEILGILTVLLVAGTETTTNLVSSALLRLAASPSLAHRLREEPELIQPFVEEVLRLDSPAQGIFRLVTADLEVGGVEIPAGSHLFLAYCSANLDGSPFPEPTELRLDRGAAHLAFGHGLHFCLGAPVARREARIALDRLLSRFSGVELGPGFEPHYRPSYFLRGLDSLPLRLTPTAAG